MPIPGHTSLYFKESRSPAWAATTFSGSFARQKHNQPAGFGAGLIPMARTFKSAHVAPIQTSLIQQ